MYACLLLRFRGLPARSHHENVQPPGYIIMLVEDDGAMLVPRFNK